MRVAIVGNSSPGSGLLLEAMKLKVSIVKGNLIEMAKDGVFDFIAHGCNCFQCMGAGIASAIRREFPLAYQADLDYGTAGDREKLGTFSIANIDHKFNVINMYTQYNPGADFHIDHLRKACAKLYSHIKSLNTGECYEIGFPWIGCGIGGGNKDEVIEVLTLLHNGYGTGKVCNVTIVEL